jgi:ABC-type transport system substrate-binding protein
VKKILNKEFPDIGIMEAKYSGFRRLIFNVVNPPFNDLKLRQAVLYALDKKNYLDGAFWGLGEPANLALPRENPWYVKLPETKRDLAKVKALLKEAKVGADFEVEILARRGEEPETEILREQLTSAGIKTRIALLESAGREARTRAGDFQMVLSGMDVPVDPGDDYSVEYGCNPEELAAKRRGQNQSGYCNKNFDRLMGEAAKTQDPKKRYELYANALGILNQEIPAISMAFVPRYFTYRQKVRGYQTDGGDRFNAATYGLSRVWIEP